MRGGLFVSVSTFHKSELLCAFLKDSLMKKGQKQQEKKDLVVEYSTLADLISFYDWNILAVDDYC